MSQQYDFKYLLSPFQVGPMKLRNRIMTTGHLLTMGDNEGTPTERHANYFAERAKGGAAWLTWGWPVVHPSGKGQYNTIQAWDDKIIPGVKRITDVVHENGAVFVAQLGHGGRQGTSTYSERALWSSSDVPCPVNREKPKAMEIEDIKEMIEAHAAAALRMKQGGCDGVEIHSGYGGYFLSQFISPVANKRTDEYGGNLENRTRIVFEIIDAIRDRVGYDIALGILINAEDYTPAGIGIEEYVKFAKMLDACGKLDWIGVKAGTWYCTNMIVPDMLNPLAMWQHLDAAIKAAVTKTPVVAVGRINDPVLAEKILADGHADMIAMTRAQIADPELANKTREGRVDDIRKCIACNQGCIDTVFKGRPMTCLQNPAVGKEETKGIGKLKAANPSKNVMVIGGGVAGLKVAEIAARRGHKVTLYEKDQELGGQVALAARIPAREEFGGAARWLIQQVEKLGVDIRLGVAVTPEMVLSANPDTVVVATGSIPQRDGFINIRPDLSPLKGMNHPNVITDIELLRANGSYPLGEHVVVVDDGQSFWRLLGTALWLAEDLEKKVEVTTCTAFAGVELGICSMPPIFSRLHAAGVKFTPFTGAKEFTGNSLIVYNVYLNEDIEIKPVDNVVLSLFNKADDSLYFALKGRVKELYRVGDCEAPRRALDAIRDADDLARKI